MKTLSADPAWQDVLDAFAATYRTMSAGSSRGIRYHADDVTRRIERCRADDPHIVLVPPESKPVCAHLEGALAAAEGPFGAAFGRALARVAAGLAWRYGYQAMPEALRSRYAYTELVGPRGPVACRDLILGLVLFGPGCDYPPHAHEGITESYICLSGAISQNDTGVWIPGSLILNPPGRVHAITSDERAPALLAYAWTGTREALAGFEMVFTPAGAASHVPLSKEPALTPDAFETSLDHATPPAGLGPVLQALWWAKKGDWNRAHELAQSHDDKDGAWVHAYLHRVEGDDANAGYWYRRAGQPYPEQSLEAEWHTLVARMLG